MDINKILSADILDIIFEGRNKEYGAYDLRKTYNDRLRNALLVVLGIFLITFLSNFIVNNISTSDKNKDLVVKDVTLEEAPKDKPPPPPPPPPKLPPPPPIKTIQFTPPKIVKDEEVVKPPVENKELEEAKVDVKTQEGEKDKGIVAPPVEDKGSKVIEVPADDNVPFTKVEVEASFNGNWNKYLKNEIDKHIDELSDADNGTCVVKFIVWKDGSVTDVEATTMKGTKLAELAVQAIKKGPKWTPAIQNGRQVPSYKLQPVTFTMAE
jgi:periplasmic protein TonB